MSALGGLLDRHVREGSVPGAVAVLARGDDVEVVVAGHHDLEHTTPMARDTLFRVMSVSKLPTAAAVLSLVDQGSLALDDPVARWLPELADPVVVRSPDGPLDDLVPAARPVTVDDLLTFRCGWGFPDDFSWPAVAALLAFQGEGTDVQDPRGLDGWLADLARVPMVAQPGERWLYNTGSDLQGALVARVCGRPFGEVLAERVLGPLGMTDTAFGVAGDLGRLPTAYRTARDVDGAPAAGDPVALEVADRPDGQFARPPARESGAGGLVSCADDLLAFGRMLLAGGDSPGGRVLSAQAVTRMTTDHLTAAQREAGRLFLEGQGWGHGGSVDLDPDVGADPWTVLGRYGWVGGSGTSLHVVPSRGTVEVLLTQRYLDSPVAPRIMRDVWTLAATS